MWPLLLAGAGIFGEDAGLGGLFSMGGGGFMGGGSKAKVQPATSTGYFYSGPFNPIVGGSELSVSGIGLVVVAILLILVIVRRK
ncbi:MAG: hypothetical protein A2167_05445 [Planctomycetes bacterium RBG_13_46_10]|nr:MAG: hypothetical protein A2167_05445 [Planctomycetes bacterium RBG_13_46_10]